MPRCVNLCSGVKPGHVASADKLPDQIEKLVVLALRLSIYIIWRDQPKVNIESFNMFHFVLNDEN